VSTEPGSGSNTWLAQKETPDARRQK